MPQINFDMKTRLQDKVQGEKKPKQQEEKILYELRLRPDKIHNRMLKSYFHMGKLSVYS